MPRLKELSLLLLDDNAALVQLYKDALEAAGPYRVQGETDGRRARRCAEAQLFDLVVIDAKLGYRGVEFGGLRLADDLRPRYGSSSILVISRFITAEVVREREAEYEFMEKHNDSNGGRFAAALSDRLTRMRQDQHAFVAMPFNPRLDELYARSIAPAVKAAGFKCLRVDQIAHNKGIQDVIFKLVQSSKLVVFVADEASPNAYYEAGFADAMGKEVIIVARSVDELRFDVAHRHVVTYGPGSPLRAALTRKIVALRLERGTGL
jgi:CheY-like chemotaxis protein